MQPKFQSSTGLLLETFLLEEGGSLAVRVFPLAPKIRHSLLNVAGYPLTFPAPPTAAYPTKSAKVGTHGTRKVVRVVTARHSVEREHLVEVSIGSLWQGEHPEPLMALGFWRRRQAI